MSKFQVKMQPSIAVAISFALSCSSFLSPVHANPAILAPAAFCAGTAGIGCVLIGVGVVGGVVVYFIYQNEKGKKIKIMPSGRVFKSEYLEDPEKVEEVGTWEEPLNTRNKKKADEICKARAKQLGASVQVVPDPATGKWICVFTGGTGR